MAATVGLDGSPAVKMAIAVDTHQDEHVEVAIDR